MVWWRNGTAGTVKNCLCINIIPQWGRGVNLKCGKNNNLVCGGQKNAQKKNDRRHKQRSLGKNHTVCGTRSRYVLRGVSAYTGPVDQLSRPGAADNKRRRKEENFNIKVRGANYPCIYPTARGESCQYTSICIDVEKFPQYLCFLQDEVALCQNAIKQSPKLDGRAPVCYNS